ncbi:MAG: glycosyltransferase family 2 protein [Roseiflexaceae bacterium]|jgi:glycosyltransferase involved in cell wall biosynthesis|nr:glycosyltransferase [Chloroflexaceae bacterium]
MKLIVQIPALNEQDHIAEVIQHVPRNIPGIDVVEVLVIDDGSTDNTVAVARAAGADHVVSHTARRGLAYAYQTGIDNCLRHGADIIVNTDADHQYPGNEIPRLVAPILAKQADMVVGDRQVQQLEHFSPLKKFLQYIGSSVVRWASGTDVPDTVSGFRALSREAALRTFVTSDFSYTIEVLIQAGKHKLAIHHVPIKTNIVTRESRLFTSNWNFIKRQAATIARTYATYEPLKSFSYLALPFLLGGIIMLGRAAYVYIGRSFGLVATNDQALAVGSTALIIGFIIFLFGVIADRIGGVRRVEEEVLYRIRKAEIERLYPRE